MIHPAHDLTESEAAPDRVLYEQPLNERMRTFLRLELLFRQAHHHVAGRSAWETRAAIGSLLEILAILNRGDVRSEALQELERHATKLQKYESRPGVDGARLQALLQSIGGLRDTLNSAGKHYTRDLRECEFLAAIRHRSAIPGGTCEFDLPDYNHWLSRAYKHRRADFDSWLDQLQPLEAAVKETLWLTRESAEPEEQVAVGGMYQHSLERGNLCQLLRVGLPTKSALYPEVSGGQHRFTIRFRTWRAVSQKSELVTRDVKFFLARC